MDEETHSVSAKSKGSGGSSSRKRRGSVSKAKSRHEEAVDRAERSTTSKEDPELSPPKEQKRQSEDKVDRRSSGKDKEGKGSIKSKGSSNKDVRRRKSSKVKADDGSTGESVGENKEQAHAQEERHSKDGGTEELTTTVPPKKVPVDDAGEQKFSIFRVTNAEILTPAKRTLTEMTEENKSEGEAGSVESGGTKKNHRLSKRGKSAALPTPPQKLPTPPHKLPAPPPPSSVEEEFLEIEELELEQFETTSYDEDGYRFLEEESKEEEDPFGGSGEEEDGMSILQKKSKQTMLRERWENISDEISRTFNSPTRVFKLRGYHSEPDLSLPFEDKFDLTWTPVTQSDVEEKGWSALRKVGEKFVSCEDITAHISGKEHPDLVRGVLSEVKLRSYAIDDNMKSSWWDLYEAERKRFSFFDELFATGYVVDSLEVLSPPPKDADGNPVTTGEYFVEAEEKHYRKKVDYGRVVFKTKHVYTGNFQDWYFEGPGRYCWQDGTVYQGEFSKGLMHGPGSIHWPDGCIYEGRFIYGKRTGWGVYSSADGQNTYAGEWINGLPHGHGKMWYDPDDDDTDYYEGQWKRGLPEGVGTRQYATGDRYVGHWIEGMRNGYGIMIWLQERQVYKGEWLDGVPHGTGKHIWYLERTASNSFPTRHVYQGNWVMGRREGIGKMVYPCGSIYEGRWKNGQRHGKGMFMNPAGDILVGLFRAGSIMGGSDVPLHAPTYDCDYVGLTEWLMVKFKFPIEDIAEDEEEKLLELTKQFLPYLRKLYHRAGEYSQKYGRHGLYPAYLKRSKNNSSTSQPNNNDSKSLHHFQSLSSFPENQSGHHHVHPEQYSRLNEPEHMKGKTEKPESLDGVNPVTRFGLWLLLRDCEGVLDEVTMAYYDKIWCETPSLSFQTRHNPFEPVYLWQFMQALIVTSVAYCIDVPRLRQHAVEKEKRTDMEPMAVSDTTLQGGMSQAEQKRAMIGRQQRTAVNSRDPKHSTSRQTIDHLGTGGKGRKKQQGKNKGGGGTDDGKTEKKQRGHKNHGKQQEGGGPIPEFGSIMLARKSLRGSEMPMTNGENDAESGGEGMGRTSDSSEHQNIEETPSEMGGNEEAARESGDTADEMETLVLAEEEDNLSEREEGAHEDEQGGNLNGQKSNVGMEDTFAYQPVPDMTISECFELFLSDKLIPCLRREAGYNLPVVPQPLPALVDMYDAFKGIRQRDIIRGKEFFRSALPHLLFPNAKDALWWHRCPEPLSHQVDVEELLEMFREKFENVQQDAEQDENFEEKFESEYLGAQAQNSEMTLTLLKLCKDNPTAPECPPASGGSGGRAPMLPIVDSDQVLKDINNDEESVEDMAELMEFTTDGQPFAENELVPEPFLWADDYKCIPVRRKYQHFENINSSDVFNVLNQLYPKLCTGRHEKDLQFELIFCDWLWCTSLLAKTSTERECRDAWKTTKEDRRPLTNPQSLGVYAHYVRLIKDNPYLSPNPPPDFVPKRKPKEVRSSTAQPEENEERKAVKFL